MKGKLLVIELKNEQEAYAAADSLIMAAENKEKNVDIDLFRSIRVRIGDMKEDLLSEFKSNKEVFVEKIEKFLYRQDFQEKLRSICDIESLRSETMDAATFFYYFRIISENDDIVSLQYLVLLLQSLNELRKRLLCFFAPSKDYYLKSQWTREESAMYHRLSHYLRLIKYPLFWGAFLTQNKNGMLEGNESIVFRPLSPKNPGTQHTFLPLLEVDEKTYKLLATAVSKNVIDNLGISMCLEIADRIAKSKKLSDEIIADIKKKDISVLQYLLLCTVLPQMDSDVNTTQLIDLYFISSAEFTDAILQLLENIIRYSQLHKGVFTFRIHDKDSAFIRNHMIHSAFGESPSDMAIANPLSYLEVGVADYNSMETVLDNFFSRSNVVNEEIFKFKEQVRLVDMFNEQSRDDEMREAWREYRRNNGLRGMGLPRMRENAEESGAILFAKSSVSHTISTEKDGFSENYSRLEFSWFTEQNESYYLPGTQYRIVFPLQKYKEKNLVYNSDIFTPVIGDLREDEEALAEYFDYRAEQITINKPISDLLKNLSVLYYKEYLSGKDECVRLWKELLDEAYERVSVGCEKTVFYFDALELSNSGHYWAMETFCKGMIESLVLSDNGIKLFSIINCSSLLMTLFLKTYYLIGETVNYSHIYLSGLDVEKELYIVGHNRNQVEANVIQYAFPRRRLDHEYFERKDSLEKTGNPLSVVPFDVLISRYEKKNDKCFNKSIFDEYIEKVGEKELTNTSGAGYKISDTHMRLGSKVHLDSFYEVAVLFQKPRIARKIAFKVLRKMYEEYNGQKKELAADKSIWEEKILFYGYSSYTRIILESLIELAKKVCKKELDWTFAIYQNDIVVQKRNSCVSPRDDVFFNDLGLAQDDNRSKLEKYSIVQIVPISTSLTTFKKMKGKLEEILSGEGSYKSVADRIVANYTFFWVRNVNEEQDRDEVFPTEIESTYWSKINDDNSIDTNLISPGPFFFSCVRSKWNDPLMCSKCYPEELLDERVLTETDVTSTIPSVQIEKPEEEKENDDLLTQNENEERIVRLKKVLKYGHIYRENNHFQYYFDTNELFLSQKSVIESWLRGLNSEKEEKTLNIIVTPLHHTNAGFCQCVNNVVFNGNADIIFFDAAKEYKSNVEAKYADVKETIKRAKEDLNLRTRFIFVDDTIISGTAFRRINNLIHVLVDKDDRTPIQIEEVYVLINRMSESSKNNYVLKPRDSFHAFINLNISSVRNHGTSCVMCGLRRDAESFFRRASTKSMSEYWNKKLYEYREKSFDEVSDENNSDAGYYRMLCSHVAGDIYKYAADDEHIFEKILRCFENLRKRTPISPVYRELMNNKPEAVKAFLKVLVRPFFSFGKSYRQCIHDFFMFLTECFVNPSFAENIQTANKEIKVCTSKRYLNNKTIQRRLISVYRFIRGLVERDNQEEFGCFVIDYLIEGLTDIRSNYVIRKRTLINLCGFIGTLELDAEKTSQLFERIRKNVHRLINASSDETKTLWFEYLLTTWSEYPKSKEAFYLNIRRVECLDGLPQEIAYNVKNSFQSFWEDMYIDNVRLYYDGTKHIIDRMTRDEKEKGNVDRVIELLKEDYYFINYKKLINLHYNAMNYKNGDENTKKMSEAEQRKHIRIFVEFLLCLNRARKDGRKNLPNIQERYNKLYGVLKNLVWPEDVKDDGRNLDIVVESQAGHESEPDYYSLEENTTKISHTVRMDIEKAKEQLHFSKTGYYIADSLDCVIVSIQNNYEYLSKEYCGTEETIQESKIAPVYIYVKTAVPEERYRLLEIARRILMFKHQLLHLFEQDFNNDSIDDLMRSKIRNRQLARDNAGDHQKPSDLTSIMRILQSAPREDSVNDIGYWFLLRSYVNMRIGRLYRRLISKTVKKDSPIYVDLSETNKEKGGFWIYPLINLGESITRNMKENSRDCDYGKDLNISPLYYFVRLDCAFVVNYWPDGKKENGKCEEDIHFLELIKRFQKLNCIKGDKGYYRSEFIICILLDILFSAIYNSRKWKAIIPDFADEWIMMDQFNYLFNYAEFENLIDESIREAERRCVIDISVEKTNTGIDYLTIENKKFLTNEEKIEEIERCLNDLQNGGDPTKGLSLWTAKQYIEGIWDNECPLKVNFMIEKSPNGGCSFKTRLPIIVGKEE